jgi:hypothetical protein
VYSLHRIPRTLRLNHTNPKHFVQEPSPDLTMTAGEAFVGLGFTGIGRDHRGIVEMQHCNSTRMTVQGADSRDLIKPARLFWSRP